MTQQNVENRLSQLISHFGIESDSALAVKIGKSPQFINNWKRRNSISRAGAAVLVKKFGVSYEWIQYGIGPMFASGQVQLGSTLGKGVPIVSWEVAKYLCEHNKPISHEYFKEEFPWPSAPDNSYLLELSGDLMAPDYPNGSLILVERDTKAKHNDDVVVILGDGKMTFRRLKVSFESKWLEAVNDNYPNRIINFTDDCRICGVVQDYYYSKKRR